MSEIAALWGTAQLGELCSITTGDKDVNEGNPSGEFPFFTCAQEISKSNSYSFDGEAILIAGNGNFSVKKYKGKFEAYQRTYVLQNFKISPAYLYYFISHRLSEITKDNRGSTIRYIRIGNLTDYDVTFPCEQAQHRIVAKIEELFSDLDKGIENLKTAQAQLKVYRQALLKHAFEGKLTAQWRAENHDKLQTADALLKRIQQERAQRYQQQLADWQANGGSKPKAPKPLPPLTAEELSELPELPEGWGWVKIGEVTNCLDSLRVPINKTERLNRQGDVPYYGANGQVGWIDDYLFDEPLILIVEDETFTGREKPFSYKITGKAWVNNHAHILKPETGMDIDCLNFQFFFYPFTAITTGTTGRKKLTQEAMINAPIKICSHQEQIAIVERLESNLSEVDQLDQTITTSLQQAEALRQSILKKAFSGQLVPQDPHDEPASALLARIKAERAGNQISTKAPRVKIQS